MNILTLIVLIISIIYVDSQFQESSSPSRTFLRPMTRNFVGRRGPIPPSRFGRPVFRQGTKPPGFKPPTGIAKKLNTATDFRALARVLLKQ